MGPWLANPLGSIPLSAGAVANVGCEMIGLAFAVFVILLAIDTDILLGLDGREAGQIIMFSPVLSMTAHGLVESTIQVPMRGPRRYPAENPGSLIGTFAAGVTGTWASNPSDDSDG